MAVKTRATVSGVPTKAQAENVRTETASGDSHSRKMLNALRYM
jgi:hypothetical protein